MAQHVPQLSCKFHCKLICFLQKVYNDDGHNYIQDVKIFRLNLGNQQIRSTKGSLHVSIRMFKCEVVRKCSWVYKISSNHHILVDNKLYQLK